MLREEPEGKQVLLNSFDNHPFEGFQMLLKTDFMAPMLKLLNVNNFPNMHKAICSSLSLDGSSSEITTSSSSSVNLSHFEAFPISKPLISQGCLHPGANSCDKKP